MNLPPDKPFVPMRKERKLLITAAFLLMGFLPSAAVNDHFTTAEQEQINIATKGLFARGNVFNIDFGQITAQDYSFPLPVGKAKVVENNGLRIVTSRGDAVKAMFDGVVRLSRKSNTYGHVIVVRHDNGLETVYANNAQNLVKVGQHVSAGQTIAIVGTKDGQTYCDFSIMVNGGRINPETILEVGSHRLRHQVVVCRKDGKNVNVSVETVSQKKQRKSGPTSLSPDDEIGMTDGKLEINLANMEKEHWAYPLAGSHVISPYGGRRNHSGVDLKTKPNDDIVAAFDGVVARSGPYFGYGNCIVIRHAYGFETLYSHQSKNLVKVGDKVTAGQVIGLTGRTGRATTEHLHFEVNYKGHRLNPAMLFDHLNHSLQNTTLTITSNGQIKSSK